MLGSDHPSVLRDMFNLASILLVQQRYADAEAMYKELIESARRVLGPQHPGTLAAMGNLAALLEKEKRFADAEKLNRQVLDAQRQTLGA